MADYVINAADVKYIGGPPIEGGIAGVAIVAGNVIALDAATGRLVLADADFIITNPMKGMALNNAQIGQPVSYAPNGATVRVKAPGGDLDVTGEPIFLSQTAGKLIPHTDVTVGAGYAGYPMLVGFATPAPHRENIRLAFAAHDETFND